MVEVGGKRKRTGAAKMSRHKKAYWRKGANVQDIEESFAEIQAEKAAGGQIQDRPDEDIFQIDRTARVEEVDDKKFTKRQKAALQKISLLSDGDVDRSFPFPKKPKGKLEKLPGRTVTVMKAKEKKKKDSYDVWDTELDVKLDVHEAAAEGGDFYLKQTKKVISKKPKTLNIKPSLLKAVEVPEAGASYNPEIKDYTEYVNSIANDEMKIIAEEQALENSLAVDPSQLVTQADRVREDAEGLFADKETEELKAEIAKLEQEEEAQSFLTGPVENKLKTRRERAKAKAHKEKLKLALQAKLAKQVDAKIFKSKKYMRQLAEKEKAEAEAAGKRANRKKLDDVTKRKKLGRGKFEEQEAPFLLQDELVGNLRQLKPQGNLVEDRMKSLQKRNMLPIAGERNSRRLKTKLKVKHVEKRSHQQVTLGYKPK